MQSTAFFLMLWRLRGLPNQGKQTDLDCSDVKVANLILANLVVLALGWHDLFALPVTNGDRQDLA